MIEMADYMKVWCNGMLSSSVTCISFRNAQPVGFAEGAYSIV